MEVVMNAIRLRVKKGYVVLGGVVLLLAGCATTSVQPWERGNLAKEEMGLDGNVLEGKFTEHIYTSKEASSGGKGVGGGGCGCN
jgi:Domain of unknown function (DUF4266)